MGTPGVTLSIKILKSHINNNNNLTKLQFWIFYNHQSNRSMQDVLKCKEEEMNLKMLLVLSIFSGPLHAQEFWEKADTSFHESVSTLITNDSGHIFAGTSNGIYRTFDNSKSRRSKNEINN